MGHSSIAHTQAIPKYPCMRACVYVRLSQCMRICACVQECLCACEYTCTHVYMHVIITAKGNENGESQLRILTREYQLTGSQEQYPHSSMI